MREQVEHKANFIAEWFTADWAIIAFNMGLAVVPCFGAMWAFIAHGVVVRSALT